jgi:hypothetical protein
MMRGRIVLVLAPHLEDAEKRNNRERRLQQLHRSFATKRINFSVLFSSLQRRLQSRGDMRQQRITKIAPLPRS